MILIHQRHRRTDGQHAISIPRYALVHRAVKRYYRDSKLTDVGNTESSVWRYFLVGIRYFSVFVNNIPTSVFVLVFENIAVSVCLVEIELNFMEGIGTHQRSFEG